jgi:hypothetical protein
VDTKPLRVTDDPEVALTSADRKRMFDLATEMHDLQKRLVEAQTALAALNRQLTELADAIGKRTDLPTDVKTSFDAVKKDVDTLTPKLTAPAGRGFGGSGRGDNPSIVTRITQAKNGYTAGMPVTEVTTRAYTEAKTQAPKAVADLNAAIAKAAALSPTLARYNLTLNVPQPVKPIETAATAKRSSSQ